MPLTATLQSSVSTYRWPEPCSDASTMMLPRVRWMVLSPDFSETYSSERSFISTREPSARANTAPESYAMRIHSPLASVEPLASWLAELPDTSSSAPSTISIRSHPPVRNPNRPPW